MPNRGPWSRRAAQLAGVDLNVTAASTGTQIPFRGSQVIFSTAAGKKHFLTGMTKAGQGMEIICRRATTTLTAWVILPSGWAFQKTSNSTGTTFRKLTFNGGLQAVTLRTISTSKVAVVTNTGTVTIGTS